MATGKWSLVLIGVGALALAVALYFTAALIWGLPLPGGFEPPPRPEGPLPTSRLISAIYGPEARERSERHWERQIDAMNAEVARQQRIINALYREYLATHADVDPSMQVGTADLPKEWVENRLTEMGEQWVWKRYRPDV
ncbi:MAG: hypothetical protein ABSD85_05650 [Acidimicrobiales bacterium]